MALTWWRAHADNLNDQIIQELPGDLFKAWFNIQCVLAQENSHNGKLPDLKTLSFRLRKSVNETVNILVDLTSLGILKAKTVTVKDKNGDDSVTKCDGKTAQKNLAIFHDQTDYFFIDWDNKQYKSDSSTDRTKRWRERHKNVTGTAPDQIRSDTDQIRSEGGDLLIFDNDKAMGDRGEVPRTRNYAGDYRIQRHLTDEEIEQCRILALGRDLQVLYSGFDGEIKRGRFVEPQHPFLAFSGWIRNYTKGQRA